MAVNINVPSQVKTYANLAAFPASGALKTIYIAEDTNKTYRWTGSVYVEVSAAGATGITIGTTAITSGTVGRVLFEGTGNVVQESSSFTYDDTLKVFTITGTIGSVLQHTALSNYNGLGGFQLNVSGGTERGFLKLNPTTGEVRIGATGSGYFPTFYAQGVEAMRIFASTRNIGVNTTTDAGFRLDVNGTARVSGVFTTSIINNLALTTGGFGTTGYGMAIDAGFRWGVNAGNSYKFGHWSALNGAFNWNNASASVIEVGMGATTPNVNNITWTSLNITPTFNADFSGRSGNIIRGIYYNPTITSLVNGVRNQLRAFESSFGGAYFNTTTVDGSAILQADSTTQGFLPPRMTTTQKNAIASPATGLVVYDTTLNKLCVRAAAAWETITSI